MIDAEILPISLRRHLRDAAQRHIDLLDEEALSPAAARVDILSPSGGRIFARGAADRKRRESHFMKAMLASSYDILKAARRRLRMRARRTMSTPTASATPLLHSDTATLVKAHFISYIESCAGKIPEDYHFTLLSK